MKVYSSFNEAGANSSAGLAGRARLSSTEVFLDETPRMTRFRWVLIGLATSAIGACQLFGGLGGLEFKGKTSSGLAGGGGAGQGGSVGQGAGTTLSSGGAGPSTSTSSTTSTSSASSTSSGGNGLDPNLSLPDPSGMPCSNIGNETDYPNTEVCRIASKTGGRCESCTNCGRLDDPCATGQDCDIVFECYRGHCTNFCMVGTSECGPVQDCIDVGNDTSGVCWPVP